MRMFAKTPPGYCTSCEARITGRPVYRMDEAHCCAGCAEGGPCVCNYEADLADDGVNNLGLMVPVPAEPAALPAPRSEEPVGAPDGVLAAGFGPR
jgi:hypothetical protein